MILLLNPRVWLAALLSLLLWLPAPASRAATVTGLYTFNNADPSGGAPQDGLTSGSDGFLYGTATQAAPGGIGGSVFKIKPDGTGFTVLHTFAYVDGNATSQPASDGSGPTSRVIQAADGFFYGTTYDGGEGTGIVFKISADGQTYVILHQFAAVYANGQNADGANPYAALIQGSDGFLYGTTVNGGANGSGAVFKISTDGQTFSLLHSFSLLSATDQTNTDGASPDGLVQGSDGLLYGVADSGGANGSGTVFKIAADGSGFATVYAFSATDANGVNGDGTYPLGALVQGTDGLFYGVANGGGANGTGAVFQMSRDGRTMHIVHNFGALDGSGSNADGQSPQGSLMFGRDGLLYGAASGGGANGSGVLFQVSTDGAAFQTLCSFSGAEGSGPNGTWVFGPDGALYGTAQSGGTNGNGTVFRVGMGHTHVLWSNSNGEASLWTLGTDGIPTGYAYGPFPGWTAKLLADDPQGRAHVLWTNTNGQIALWTVAPDGTMTGTVYEPVGGWTPVSLTIGPDNHAHILWNHASDHVVALWDIAPGAAPSGTAYGPYAGWTATHMAVGPDNHLHMLWINTNSDIDLWDIAPGTEPTGVTYSPAGGWTPRSLTIGPDNHAHILWNHPADQQMALWDIAPGAAPTGTAYLPYAAWTAGGLAVGPDNHAHVLWNNPDTSMSLWDIAPGASPTGNVFDPGGGWTAIAISSGP